MTEDTKVVFTAEQQALVDKLVGEARVKAREKAEADQATQTTKAKEDSDKAALVAEQKWKELAEVHQARVAQLEPFEAQAKAYGELITGMLKDRIKELGDEAKKAVGALPDSMTPVEKLAWLNENVGLFQDANDERGTSPRSQRKTSRPEARASRTQVL